MASTPSRRTPLVVLTVSAVAIAASCWGLYSSEGAVKARERDARLAAALEGEASPDAARPVVDVVAVQRARAPEVVELSGMLEPVRSTWVASEIAGSIVEVPAAEHAPIARGGVLVRLDPALPRAEVVRAQASYDLAKLELERQQKLGTRSVASQAELDRAAAEERQRFAELLEARTRVGHTTITAPFDGLVNSLDLDPGAYVSPGTKIAEVLDVSRLELTVRVSDRQIGAISVGDAVRVRVDALGSRLREGRVVRKGFAPQGDTQRYPVVIELPAAVDGDELLPGMLAHVLIEVGEAETIRLPASAVVRQFEIDHVYVVDEDDRVRRLRVSARPVPFRPDQVEIAEGLEEGARVAVTAVSQLRVGATVEPRVLSSP